MAWMITLISGVNECNNNMVGIIEDESAADECATLLLEIYNRDHPEYIDYVLTEVIDGTGPSFHYRQH